MSSIALVSPIGEGVDSRADVYSVQRVHAGTGGEVEFPISGDLIAAHRAKATRLAETEEDR